MTRFFLLLNLQIKPLVIQTAHVCFIIIMSKHP